MGGISRAAFGIAGEVTEVSNVSLYQTLPFLQELDTIIYCWTRFL